jgi:hypothetical protein
MKKILHSFSILSLILLYACEKSSEITIDENPISSNLIQLTNLQVGQKSTYVRWGTCSYNKPSDNLFEASTDTLLLEILSKDDNGFLVKESVNQETYSCIKAPISYPQPFLFYLKQVGDSLIVKNKPSTDSRLSRLFSNRNLPLKPVSTNPKTLNKWLLPELTSDTYWGFDDNIVRNNTNFGKANIWWDGTSIVLDGPYRGLIYNNQNGIIAHISLGSQLPHGIIWYLQPQ